MHAGTVRYCTARLSCTIRTVQYHTSCTLRTCSCKDRLIMSTDVMYVVFEYCTCTVRGTVQYSTLLYTVQHSTFTYNVMYNTVLVLYCCVDRSIRSTNAERYRKKLETKRALSTTYVVAADPDSVYSPHGHSRI